MDEMPDLAVAAQRALEFLEQTGAAKPWLLIYDNVANPKSLDGLKPRAGARVLMTSHFRDWFGPAKPVTLGELTPQEAVQYLLGRTDEAGAARLAVTLRNLPLMLNYAAAFCVGTGDSFDGYGQRLVDWITNDDLGFHFPRICLAVISLAPDRGVLAGRTASLLSGVAQFLHFCAFYIEAEPLMRRSLAIAETKLGPAHPEMAVLLKSLARLLIDTNRLAEAEPLMRRALSIDEWGFRSDHPKRD